MVLAPLLLFGARPAATDGVEAPVNVVAFANAPAAITVAWTHSGDGVYYFVLEQQSPFAFTQMDAAKRAWTVVSLQPSTTYSYRVCAVYDTNRVCSDYAGVTTMRAEAPPAPTVPPAYVPPPGSVSFESNNYRGRFIRHRTFLGELTPVVSDLDRADTTFFVRPGLSGTPQSVSLESVNYRGHYLRHQNFRIKLNENDGSELFRKDASFVMREYDSVEKGWWYFESVNFPNHYIRHQNFELWLARTDRSQLFLLDSLFGQRRH